MTILVIAEHDNASLKAATLNTVAAAAKIGGLADIGLGLQIGPAQQKHGWSDGNSREDFEVTLGSEFQALGQHGIIVSKNPSWRH